jgi:uncharacterized RDD family membrane protein YckC
MPIDDRIGVITPEAVEFTFDLSGLASRVMALIVDLIIQAIVVVGIIIVASPFISQARDAQSGMEMSLVMFFIISYVIDWGYFMFFELTWNGRSPGKRLMNCRVIRDGGLPVNFTSSLIRNFLRPVDYLLSALMVGFFIVFASPTYKRLGDIAAGTIVITERRISIMHLLAVKRVGMFRPTYPPLGLFTKADIGHLSTKQMNTIRRFLERRFDIPPARRRGFASELFNKVLVLIPAAEGHGIPEEQVLEEIVIASESDITADR